MRKGVLALAAGCLTAAAGWHFAARDHFAYRIGRDWKYEMRYIGSQTNADPVTGTLPSEDGLGFYERRIRVLADGDWPRSVVLDDAYRVVERGTNKVIFEYITRDTVNPKTGMRIGAAAGDFVVFPRNVQKTTYYLSSNYLEHLPVSFEHTDKVDGIETYVFAYRGPVEYTNAYRGSADYPGVQVGKGQEIRCIDDQFFFRAWVEPTTGEVAQMEEGCPSADYIIDVASGKRLSVVDRWDGRSEGNAEMTDAVRAARSRFLWGTRYVPLCLLAAAVLAAAAGVFPRVKPEAA